MHPVLPQALLFPLEASIEKTHSWNSKPTKNVLIAIAACAAFAILATAITTYFLRRWQNEIQGYLDEADPVIPPQGQNETDFVKSEVATGKIKSIKLNMTCAESWPCQHGHHLATYADGTKKTFRVDSTKVYNFCQTLLPNVISNPQEDIDHFKRYA